MTSTSAQTPGSAPGLTDEERALLLELFKASPNGSVGFNARTFRVKHPREKQLIRKLETDELIRTEGDNYLPSLVAIAALRTNETSNLLMDAENIYATLRAAFEADHQQRVAVSSLAVDTGLGEEATRRALSYMLSCTLWVESAPIDVMNQKDAVIGMSEGIQDYESFSEVVNQLDVWRLERMRQRASGNWAGASGASDGRVRQNHSTNRDTLPLMNTAGRILQIYDRLMQVPLQPGSRAILAWGFAFGLPADVVSDEDVIGACVRAFRAELVLLKKKLATRDAPEELWNRCVSHFQAITAMGPLQSDWKQVADEIKKFEYRLQFAWAAWALRDEDGEEISVEEQSALRESLYSLEASLSVSDLSPSLQLFVQAQIDVIRSALRLYAIQGVRSIRNALKTVAGAVTLDHDELAEEMDHVSDAGRKVMRATGELIQHTAQLANQADKLTFLVTWNPSPESQGA